MPLRRYRVHFRNVASSSRLADPRLPMQLCRRHAARTTSDPAGRVFFRIREETALVRYRFGLRTADFLVCRNCGVLLGAVLTSPRGQFATLNVRALGETDRI